MSVGLLTGDVQIRTEAPCLIMTTEILRYMIVCTFTSNFIVHTVSQLPRNEVYDMEVFLGCELCILWSSHFLYCM